MGARTVGRRAVKSLSESYLVSGCPRVISSAPKSVRELSRQRPSESYLVGNSKAQWVAGGVLAHTRYSRRRRRPIKTWQTFQAWAFRATAPPLRSSPLPTAEAFSDQMSARIPPEFPWSRRPLSILQLRWLLLRSRRWTHWCRGDGFIGLGRFCGHVTLVG